MSLSRHTHATRLRYLPRSSWVLTSAEPGLAQAAPGLLYLRRAFWNGVSVSDALSRALIWLVLYAFSVPVWGGGSGLNVAIVANRSSSNSLALANYYREQREVPPQNVLYIDWPNTPVQWSRYDFEKILRHPLHAMIGARSLSNQVEYVVLSMDIPYRVRDSDKANSTTSALFYGFKFDTDTNVCSLPDIATNHYSRSEGIFRASPPALTNGGFLAVMLTSSNLDQAARIVDHGVSSDATFPLQPVYLAKSIDRLRNVRHYVFDEAIYDNRVLGRRTLIRTNTDTPLNLGFAAGYQNGSATFRVPPGMFAPGSMADDLTSFGGILFERNDQTSLLEFLNAGATGSYGTVVEPCSYLEKFPLPMNYFYQARGFSLAESYYQALAYPYMGQVVGEPLAAPFSNPGHAQWMTMTPGTSLAGATNLALRFSAPGVHNPVAQVDLFIDGTFFRTLTNVAPSAGNTLNVNLGGRAIPYTVRQGATLKTIASGLADAINARTNITRVKAEALGDRLELQGLDLAKRGSAISLAGASTRGNAPALTTFLQVSGPALLDTVAYGARSYLITNTPAPGDFLELRITRTNGLISVHSVTNQNNLKLNEFVKSLLARVEADSSLKGPDGVVIEDINMHEDFPYTPYAYGTNDHSGTFTIRAAAPGWPQSQIQVVFHGSPSMEIETAGTNRLDENVSDLRPRAHLYLSAGFTNLYVNHLLDTTRLSDGHHEFTAVGYEGTHVRTQTRVSLPVIVRNTGLEASLSASAESVPVGSPLVLEATSSALGATFELHGTGGVLSIASNNPAPVFILDSARLGVGLHSFAALATDAHGARYRTAPVPVRVLPSGVPAQGFTVAVWQPDAQLTWPAEPGRKYDVLRTTNPAGPYAVVATLQATNSVAIWKDPEGLHTVGFYRVRTSR